MSETKRANIFAYGTLTDTYFVDRLCGRHVEVMDAKLEGYAKEKPEGCSYYIAAKRDGSAIEGKLLLDLTPDELKMLNFWEEYGISREELLKRRDEIWELIVRHDRLDGFSRIAMYRRVLEKAVTSDGNTTDTFVYVKP